jgi:hypothetical protein
MILLKAVFNTNFHKIWAGEKVSDQSSDFERGHNAPIAKEVTVPYTH